jgi:hypothetical protein
MFALGGSFFPRSHEEFAQSLSEGLAIFGSVPGIRVMRNGTFPEIPRLEVDLSGGFLSDKIRKSARASGTALPGVRIQELTVRAFPLRLPDSQIDFHFEAKNVALDYDRNAEEHPILTMTFAEMGRFSASSSRIHFESLALALARKAAAEQEAAIESIAISLDSRGSRNLAFNAAITARKMIFTVKVKTTGRIHLDNQLTAHLSDLNCSGEDILSAGAAELLRPHLSKFSGKSFPLSALPIGNVQIRDLALHPGDPIRLEAEFSKG